MNCEQIQPNLLDYSQGLLSANVSEEVRTHIGECEECAALLEEEAAFAARLESLPANTPVHDVWPVVEARTRPRRFAMPVILRSLFGSRLRQATAAAMALVVLLAVILITNPFNEPKQAPTINITSEASVRWSDDPLGAPSDDMLATIESM